MATPPSSPPSFLTQLDLVPAGRGSRSYRSASPLQAHGEVTFLVVCDAASYPLAQHCRHARLAADDLPYTFRHMRFSPDPPGLRVGPWPGWRGIPPLPPISVSCGDRRADTHPSFWGDEMTQHLLRVTCTAEVDGEAAVTVESGDNRIVPSFVRAYATSWMRAHPIPVTLREGIATSHPRLLITTDQIPSLRTRRESTHAWLWSRIQDLLRNRDITFATTPESKLMEGPERLSDEDRVVITAFVALVDPEPGNIGCALDAYRSYVARTRQPGFDPLQIDTQAGETLFILCTGYDWLCRWMPPDELTATRAWLWQVAGICRAHLREGRRDYGQAHYLGCGLGLLAFSLLFWNEHESARAWAAELRGAIDCAVRLLSPDGFHPHGVNLWVYEFGFLLRWAEMLRVCTGDDLFAGRDAWHAASRFRGAVTSPDGLYGVVTGDPQFRVGGDSWCHFLIAARSRSAEAQRVGLLLSDLPHAGVDYRNQPARRRVYEFLFFDPSVPAAAQAASATILPEAGAVIVRSERTLFTFRSGPPLGMHRYAAGEYGAYGHGDPAHGSFLLYAHNSLAVSGPGPVYRRDTSLHNVVTFDGQGQIGDSAVWLPDFLPPEVLAPRPQVRHDGSRVCLQVHLAPAYLPHLGVALLHRSMIVEPGRFVAGVDTVERRGGRSIEWNIHSWSPITAAPSGAPALAHVGRDTRLLLLAPAEAVLHTGLSAFVPAYPNDGTRDFFLRAVVHTAATRFVWCLLLGTTTLVDFAPADGPVLRFRFSGAPAVTFDGTWFAAAPDDEDPS